MDRGTSPVAKPAAAAATKSVHFSASASNARAAPASVRPPWLRLLLATGKYALGYAALRHALLAVLRRVGPAEFRAASNDRQTRTVLFLLSLVNVIVSHAPFVAGAKDVWRRHRSLMPASFTAVESDGTLRGGEDFSALPTVGERDEAKAQHWYASLALENIIGYLAHDLAAIVATDGGIATYPADVFHHVSGLAIGLTCLANLRRAYPFVGLFLVAELSTLFLNMMWLMREYPTTVATILPSSAIRTVIRDRIVPLTFAATFGVVRAVTFPLMMVRLHRAKISKPDDDATTSATTSTVLYETATRPGAVILGLLQLLQWYWFALIVRKVVGSRR